MGDIWTPCWVGDGPVTLVAKPGSPLDGDGNSTSPLASSGSPAEHRPLPREAQHLLTCSSVYACRIHSFRKEDRSLVTSDGGPAPPLTPGPIFPARDFLTPGFAGSHLGSHSICARAAESQVVPSQVVSLGSHTTGSGRSDTSVGPPFLGRPGAD